uniref:Uncharacterized protein n=1 Tax=Vespula pensylvanica TaxID=30213 RepID=A0A834KSX2_VESPE|nr:hypothetical protein H0235_013276 [Vespula pensylvanica]
MRTRMKGREERVEAKLCAEVVVVILLGDEANMHALDPAKVHLDRIALYYVALQWCSIPWREGRRVREKPLVTCPHDPRSQVNLWFEGEKPKKSILKNVVLFNLISFDSRICPHRAFESGSIVVLSHVEAFGLGKVPFARSKNYLAESNFEADSGEWGTRD